MSCVCNAQLGSTYIALKTSKQGFFKFSLTSIILVMADSTWAPGPSFDGTEAGYRFKSKWVCGEYIYIYILTNALI